MHHIRSEILNKKDRKFPPRNNSDQFLFTARRAKRRVRAAHNADVMDYGIAYSRFIGKMRRRKQLPAKRFQLHHVIPKSLGGGEDVVKVTPDEHVYAHMLINMSLLQRGRVEDFRRLDYAAYRPDAFRIMNNSAFRKTAVSVEDAEGSAVMPLAEAGRRLAALGHPESAVFPGAPSGKVSPRVAYKFAMRIFDAAAKRDGRYFKFRFRLILGESRGNPGA